LRFGIHLMPFRLVAQLFEPRSSVSPSLTWSARNATSDAQSHRVGTLRFDGLGFVLSVVERSRIPNAIGWLNVAIYILLALSFGYFQFLASAP
jgi:hypothetical protein